MHADILGSRDALALAWFLSICLSPPQAVKIVAPSSYLRIRERSIPDPEPALTTEKLTEPDASNN